MPTIKVKNNGVWEHIAIGGGSGNIDIDLDGSNTSEPNSVNADTLGGYPADEYVRKDQLTDFAPTSPVELNYSVVGGMEEPVNSTQNMIWIQTETPIGRVFFGNDEPNETFIEGDVYICTGTSSSVAFNSLKIGNSYMDMVYPLSAKQYVGGAWVDKTAMSYHGGEWVYWWNGELFENGNPFTGVTGGWTTKAWPKVSGQSEAAPSLAFNDTNMVITQGYKSDDTSGFGATITQSDIDLTEFKTITAEIVSMVCTGSGGTPTPVWSVLLFAQDRNASGCSGLASTECAKETAGNYSNIILTLDVSELSGAYCVGIGTTLYASDKNGNTVTTVKSVRCSR